MKKILLGLSVLVLLTGCESPAARMSPRDIASLSNQQLCVLNNGYGWEEKTQIEIGRRNLNCDPVFNECVSRGIKPNTSDMALCMNEIRQTQALESQVKKQESELEYQRTLNDIRLKKQANQPELEPKNKNPYAPQFCPGFPFCH